MPEITAVTYMTDNLKIWLKDVSIEGVTFYASANGKRIHLDRMSCPTGAPLQIIRRGKHSVVIFERGALIFCYNLSGKVVQITESEPEQMRLELQLSNGRKLGWVDRINLGEIHWLASDGDPIVAKVGSWFKTQKNLGPEFWPERRSWEWWKGRFGHKKRFLYQLLLDQSNIAGIGNIIALETLFRAKIAPQTRASDLDDSAWGRVQSSVYEVVEASSAQHRALRLKQQDKEGEQAFRGELSLVAEGDVEAKGFLIYGRKGGKCPACTDGIIQKSKMAGRPIYWCPLCQKS